MANVPDSERKEKKQRPNYLLLPGNFGKNSIYTIFSLYIRFPCSLRNQVRYSSHMVHGIHWLSHITLGNVSFLISQSHDQELSIFLPINAMQWLLTLFTIKSYRHISLSGVFNLSRLRVTLLSRIYQLISRSTFTNSSHNQEFRTHFTIKSY